MICKICGQEVRNKGISQHCKKHNLNIKDYYDAYMKKEGEGICPTCHKPTKYLSYLQGYEKYCSLSCNPSSKKIHVCQICKKEFSTNSWFIRHIEEHNISIKDYYDKYMKKENEGFCKVCGKETKFINISCGYKIHCSNKCARISATNSSKQTYLNKYGVENPLQDPNIKAKMKETYIKNNGGMGFASKSAKEKFKETILEKYGVEDIMQNKEILEKAQETQRNNHNGQLAWNTSKQKETMLNKYGVEYPIQNKDIKEKIKQTNLKNLGVEYPAQSKEVYDKIKQTNLEKYGSPIANMYGSKEFKDRMLKKYGVEAAMQSPELKERLRQNNIDKYGVGCNFQREDIREKIKQTNLEKYGVEIPNAYGSPQFKENMIKKYGYEHATHKHYLYENIFFDSSWELAFYIFCKNIEVNIVREPIQLEYFDNNNNRHLYYPDFQLEDDRFEDNHVLIEIKGDHMLNDQMQLIDPKTKEIDYAKTQCMIDNHVYIMTFKDCEPFIKYCQEKFNDKKWYRQFIYHKDKDT